MRPAKGTPEYNLWLAAIDISIAAPMKKGSYSHSAQIPWTMIHALRDALDDLGIDWRAQKR